MNKEEGDLDFRKIFKIAILSFFIFVVVLILIISLIKSSYKSIDKEKFSKIEEKIVLVEYLYGGKNMQGVYFESMMRGSGVLTYEDNDSYYILTNRHLVDCGFWNVVDMCWEKSWERMQVETSDGKKHNVVSISYSPHGLDIVQLEIKKSDKNYGVVDLGEAKLQNKVIAAGYPVFSDNTLKLSVKEGIITEFNQLIANENFSFKVIQSNAYSNFESTGGGLFDDEGKLLGITIWSHEYSACAIDYSEFYSLINNFSQCEEGYYFKSDECVKRCQDTEMRSILDGKCYKKASKSCEDSTYFCEEDYYCLNNQCIKCPANTHLFRDGQCYFIKSAPNQST